ncbi:hypothetical protein T439DRAFT_336343 [Meredithblackwellia eburnea MCA 4105]
MHPDPFDDENESDWIEPPYEHTQQDRSLSTHQDKDVFEVKSRFKWPPENEQVRLAVVDWVHVTLDRDTTGSDSRPLVSIEGIPLGEFFFWILRKAVKLTLYKTATQDMLANVHPVLWSCRIDNRSVDKYVENVLRKNESEHWSRTTSEDGKIRISRQNVVPACSDTKTAAHIICKLECSEKKNMEEFQPVYLQVWGANSRWESRTATLGSHMSRVVSKAKDLEIRQQARERASGRYESNQHAGAIEGEVEKGKRGFVGRRLGGFLSNSVI